MTLRVLLRKDGTNSSEALKDIIKRSHNDQLFLLYLCTHLLTLLINPYTYLFYSYYLSTLLITGTSNVLLPICQPNQSNQSDLQFEPSLVHSKDSIECSTAFLPSHYVYSDGLIPLLPQHHKKHS